MRVISVNNQSNPNFGIRISAETIQRANQALMEHVERAKRLGLTLSEYNALHREDYIHRVGNNTYDFYAIAGEIVADKENLNKAFGDAWNRVRNSRKS